MRKLIVLFIALCGLLTVRAQELTLETTAGNLHTLLTEDQQRTVSSLILIGSMNDSDFYFIRDEMNNLKLLDLKEVETDTIPAKAFYHYNCDEVHLPARSLYIETSAFERNQKTGAGVDEIIITGPFPKLGGNIFGYENFDHGVLMPSVGNKYCKMVDSGDIISVDGTVYYFNATFGGDTIIPEGVETIESHAFDGARILQLEFPSTLKLIKSNAFTNFQSEFLASVPSRGSYFLSRTETPPVLEENAFEDKEDISNFTLLVPGDPNVYRQADPQWLEFENIRYGHSRVESSNVCPIRISKENDWLSIRSENEMISLEIFDMSGGKYYSDESRGNHFQIPFSFLLKGVAVVKAGFTDKTVICIKVII